MARHALPARPHRRRSRLAWSLAVLFGVVGAVLVVVGACSGRSGPPQPPATAEASPLTVATANPPTSPSGLTSAPGPVAAGRPGASRPTVAATTAPGITPPSNTVVVPSFSPQESGPVLPPSKPLLLSIPAIGVSSPILDLGLLPDGSIQTPPLDDPASKAGWYTGSPAPGSEGPAILLGHVDTRKYGPGVFYDLGRLRPGDTIEITRADGRIAVFRVDAVRSFPKAHFPTHEVYGNVDNAGLRLITCGGTFDPSKRSYESNVIAFATLVSSHPA